MNNFVKLCVAISLTFGAGGIFSGDLLSEVAPLVWTECSSS